MICRELAIAIYKLFVVNNHSVAIQAANGDYFRKCLPLTPFIIQKMIENKGAIGGYQQCYRTDRLRWVCFDFDCKEKDKPDLDELYRECIQPLTDFLESKNILFLTEFSGRRGIHVWIIFDEITTKKRAYYLMEAILSAVPEVARVCQSDKWALDRFPKTDDARGNIVGSQVKIPLSTHQKGGRSYFFKGYYLPKTDIDSADFYEEQLEILSSYIPQSINFMYEKLGIKENYIIKNKISTYIGIDNPPKDLDKIINCLEETKVYQSIFERMRTGKAQSYDWLVLLGTFTPFDTDGEYLRYMFSAYPNYDMEKTVRNIKKLRGRYYPAKFQYLYALYKIDMEQDLNPEETAVDYICRKLEGTPIQKEWENYEFIKREEIELQRILVKERNYLWDNDEVPVVTLVNKLNGIKRSELKKHEEVLNNYISIIPAYYEFVRNEEEKSRKLVSLKVQDRLITTAMALRLHSKIGRTWDSYSYQISILDSDNIFYHWYSSWGRFISQIRVYTELPFMQDGYLFYIDLKQCYSHVDLLHIFREMQNNMDSEAQKIFMYLSEYNDRLMRKLQNGNRIGVPQGPAYARILTEIYLDIIMDGIKKKYDGILFQVFRYVDDIVVVCEDERQAERLYIGFQKEFLERGMPINDDKSRYYGRISSMIQDEKKALLHADSFNYDLSQNKDTLFWGEVEKNERLQMYLMTHVFDIKMLGYIYGSRTLQIAQNYFFYQYGNRIMSSRSGRGKSFRHFYEYVLSSTGRINEAIQRRMFRNIPVDTVNYSNFIATLYYYIQDGKIIESDVNKIVVTYLDYELNFINMSEEDKIVTQSIIDWSNGRR